MKYVSWKQIGKLFLLICGLSACQPHRPAMKFSGPIPLKQLPGWTTDSLDGFVTAARHSCAEIYKKNDQSLFFERTHAPFPRKMTWRDWVRSCQIFDSEENPLVLKTYLENHFEAYQVISDEGKTTGLFTGYYEPRLEGSLRRHGPYQTPLYRRPDDLIIKEDLAQTGRRQIGRYVNGHWDSYWTREHIVSGVLHGRGLELVWVKSPLDAFFLQIQGSGIIALSNGKEARIGYDGTNGHGYFAIGRELIRRQELTPQTVSMQTIREWLIRHPKQADQVMNLNQSYVFFKWVDSPSGPIGAQGAALTPLRSLAVDRKVYPFGAFFWVSTQDPDQQALQRLMVAQDTGGAIVGAIRGDVFWGNGDIAADMAGRMKEQGNFFLIVPKPH